MLFFLLTNYTAMFLSQYLLIKTTGLITHGPKQLKRQAIALVSLCGLIIIFGLLATTPFLVGLLSLLLNLASLSFIVFAYRRKGQGKEARFQLWFAASFSLVFYYGLSYLGDILLTYLPESQGTFLTYASLMTLLLQILLYFILKRFNPYGILQSITTNVVVEGLIAAVVLLNLVIISISQFLIYAEISQWETAQMVADTTQTLNYFAIIFFVDVVVSGLLIGVSSYVLFEVKKRQLQEAIVMQQTFYIQNLEKLQLDLRVMRHDYQNILSGLVIQAQEGDLVGIQQYLAQTVSEFDTQMGQSLQQTTQLSKIEMVELKGLLLMKLAEMERLEIDCRLEILAPVKQIHMETTDLLRCVGILLDNAMEATLCSAVKELTLMISQEQADVAIMIKNRVQEQPLIQKIWEEGYSTKGSGRGLGLFSYQRIVGKYPNVLKETRFEEQQFVQILRINQLVSH